MLDQTALLHLNSGMMRTLLENKPKRWKAALRNCSPTEWRIDWLFLIAIGFALNTPTKTPKMLLWENGDVAEASIERLQEWNVTNRYGAQLRTEYTVDLTWLDFHRTRQSVKWLPLKEGDAEKLGLLSGLGRTPKTLRLRYRLQDNSQDIEKQIADNEQSVQRGYRTRCVPSAQCENLIVEALFDHNTIPAPGTINWPLTVAVSGFLLMMIARAMGWIRPREWSSVLN
jgi:hypothetical protein